MKQKALEDIKHGDKVVTFMQAAQGSFFVNDIERGTGLDNKSLRKTLTQLLKNNYVEKNDRGQWALPQDRLDELAVSEEYDAPLERSA